MGKYNREKFTSATFPKDVLEEIDKLKEKGESRGDVILRIFKTYFEKCVESSTFPTRSMLSFAPTGSGRRSTVRVLQPNTRHPDVVPDEFNIPKEFRAAYEDWKRSGVKKERFIQQCKERGYFLAELWMEALE